MTSAAAPATKGAGLAGAARLLDVARVAELVDALGVQGVGVTGGEAASPGATRLTVRPSREAGGRQRADVAALPAAGRELVRARRSRSARRTGSRWTRRRRSGGVGGGRADRVKRARVAAGHDHRRPAATARSLNSLDRVQRGDIGERVGAERLVDHAHAVPVDRVVDRLEDRGRGGGAGAAENTLSAMSFAPGAVPWIRMSHGVAGSCARSRPRCTPRRPARRSRWRRRTPRRLPSPRPSPHR